MSTEVTPITHTEQVVAGQVEPITHFEQVIAKYGGGGGGGFTPTDAQLDAMNSGIDSTKVEQITTNQNNIDGQQNATASGGNGYAIINGIRLYVASSAPTGDIPDGSIGVGW